MWAQLNKCLQIRWNKNGFITKTNRRQRPVEPEMLRSETCLFCRIWHEEMFVCRCYVSSYIYFKMHTLLARKCLLITQTHVETRRSHLELNTIRTKKYSLDL
jgi:hypothetical protein